MLLAEGVRRVPAGSSIFRRYGVGAWQAVPESEGGGTSIVSWWPPLTTSVLVPPLASPDYLAAEVSGRLSRVRLLLRVLHVLGVLSLFALVIGLPAAAGFFGVAGFIAGLNGVMTLAVVTAGLFSIGLGRLGVHGWRRFGKSVALVWPFATPSAAERLLGEALSGASSVAVARAILSADAFAEWARPRAWDALNGAPDAELERELTADEMQALVRRAVPDVTARSICPRCGATWRQDEGTCAECGVVLMPVGAR